MMRRKAIGLAAIGLALVLAASPAAAQEGKPPKPLFASSDMIELTLKAPVSALPKAPATPEKSVEGTLSLAGASPETLPILLEARGLKRRDPEVCSFPPLRVDFTTKPPRGSLFQGQNRVKLVTHCRSMDSFQQLVLLEYAAYRLYNVLTPKSFAARLARINYVDDKGRPITTRLGFFIEPGGDMAKRSGLEELNDQDSVPSVQLQPRDAVRLAFFQAMIGNLDWAMNSGPKGTGCCHNSRLIGPEAATSGIVSVPYDFDYSGLVDAPYAAPPESLPVANVRTRRYRGFCRHNGEADAVAADFLAQRANLLAVFSSIPELEDKTRARATAYIDSFFTQIAQPDGVAKLIKTCL